LPRSRRTETGCSTVLALYPSSVLEGVLMRSQLLFGLSLLAALALPASGCSKSSGESETRVAQVVFLDQEEICPITKKGINKTWEALQTAVKGRDIRVMRVYRDTQGSLARTSFGALLPIIGAGPEGSGNRLGRPFDESLTQECGASQPPVDPVLLAAAFGDWRDARVFLKLRGARVALPLFSEGNKQSRS